MPTDFEIAFANARKQGLKTFNYNGNLYTTKYREEQAFDDVLAEYPALNKVYNTDNVRISMADANRQALNKKYGGGGVMETWFPDDEGMKEFQHPSLGKYNFEFFDQNLYKDTKSMKQSLFLDMLHGMKNDDGWRKLRNEFNQNWDAKELEWLKQKYAKEANKGESLADYFDRTIIDRYLRGGLNPMTDAQLASGKYTDDYAKSFRGQFKENGNTVDFYSPTQRKIIAQMAQYLKTK